VAKARRKLVTEAEMRKVAAVLPVGGVGEAMSSSEVAERACGGRKNWRRARIVVGAIRRFGAVKPEFAIPILPVRGEGWVIPDPNADGDYGLLQQDRMLGAMTTLENVNRDVSYRETQLGLRFGTLARAMTDVARRALTKAREVILSLVGVDREAV